MKVLISGVCGFAGSHLARYLMESHEGITIVGLDNLARSGSETNRVSLKRLGVQLFHGDIRMASDLETLPACRLGHRRCGAAERAGRPRWENQHPPIAGTQLARHHQFAGVLPRLACRLHSLEHQPRLFDSGLDAVAIARGIFGLYSRRKGSLGLQRLVWLASEKASVQRRRFPFTARPSWLQNVWHRSTQPDFSCRSGSTAVGCWQEPDSLAPPSKESSPIGCTRTLRGAR